MQTRKFGIAILVLVGLIAATFVIAEMKNGLNAGNAEAAPLSGDILYVGGSGPNNYTSIQDAIDDAGDGDTIFVYNGTYYENVIINKTINLIGEDKNTTIIDGGGSGNVVYISANEVNISGFTIRNGGSSYRDKSAGIKVFRSNFSIFSNNNLYNNGIGIYLYKSSHDIIYKNNISSNKYEGITLRWCNSCFIYGNTVRNGTFGVCLYGSYFNRVSHNNLIGNEENMHIYYWGRWPLFWTNRLTGNYWDNWIGFIPKPIIAFFYPLYPLIQFDWLPLPRPYRA